MQYIKRKDKNDTKIFGGDILKIKENNNSDDGYYYTEIKYNTSYAGFEPFCLVLPYEDENIFHDLEIIGNIYENPELRG